MRFPRDFLDIHNPKVVGFLSPCVDVNLCQNRFYHLCWQMLAFLHSNLKIGKQVSDVKGKIELWRFIRHSNELSLGKSLNLGVQIS